MRMYSLLYKSLKKVTLFIENNHFNKDKKYFVKIHSSKLTKNEMLVLVQTIKTALPKSNIIGCSVGGIIFKGKNLDNETLISFIDCYDMDIKVTSIDLVSGKDYKKSERVVYEIMNNLNGIDNSFLFAFYPVNYPWPSRIVDGLNQYGKNFKMIGGGAYFVNPESPNQEIYTIFNENVYENTMVLAKLKGHLLIMNQETSTGIESIGKSYPVTKTNVNHIVEINHQPAKEWFNYLFGEDFIKKDDNIINAFPLVRTGKEGFGLNLVYNIDPFTGKDLGTDLFTFDSLSEKDEITVGYIDPNSAMSNVEGLCKKIGKCPTEILFAYSCMTRRNVLQNCAQWELQPFTSTQIVGAFMAGELVWNGKRSEYSNSAFSVAALSEDKKATVNLNMEVLEDSNRIQFDNLTLVNYIFSTANSELKSEMKENKQKLANQLIMDSATGLPNLSKFVYDNEKEQYNCLCLVSFKNERIIHVFLNKTNFTRYIQTMVEGCKKILGLNYKVYLYSDLSILIANKNISENEFVSKMLELKRYLNQLEYIDYKPIYELSIGFGEDELLKKTELLQINVHKSNKDIMIHSDDSSDFDISKELQILQVINDAISYKRVVPYYQGIYNNKTKEIDICESLMRLVDQNGKVYMPNDFLPVAKEYNLYEKLSKMMIEKVFEQANSHNYRVSINLNVQDIYNYDVLKMIFKNLQKANNPERFIFEIVEGEAIDDYAYLKEFTNKIHRLGGKIAIDDFGTGYSNLMHVLRIDFDFLKITGEIIKEICRDESCQEFVSMISNWCNTRNKNIIGEFIENEEIQNKILEYNVAYSQGYLFSKPHELEIK